MAGRRKANKMRQREALTGYAFISIWLIGFIFLFLRPLGMAFYYAFQKMSITADGMIFEYIGFENFIYKFRDDIYFFDSTVWPGLSKCMKNIPNGATWAAVRRWACSTVWWRS